MGIKWYGKIVRLAKQHINQCDFLSCPGCLSCRLSGLHTTLRHCVYASEKRFTFRNYCSSIACVVKGVRVAHKLNEISSMFIDYNKKYKMLDVTGHLMMNRLSACEWLCFLLDLSVCIAFQIDHTKSSIIHKIFHFAIFEAKKENISIGGAHASVCVCL